MTALLHVLLFLAIGIGGGLSSAWYMIDRGTALTSRQVGPWQVWRAAGHTDADPYTRAHRIRSAHLTLSGREGLTFRAIHDSQGRRLIASCEYLIVGQGPSALWWSLAAFDEQGRLFSNNAHRFAFNSAGVMRAANGRYSISIARDARPGNWLPVNGKGPIVLLMQVVGTRVAEGGAAGAKTLPEMPRIDRQECR